MTERRADRDLVILRPGASAADIDGVAAELDSGSPDLVTLPGRTQPGIVTRTLDPAQHRRIAGLDAVADVVALGEPFVLADAAAALAPTAFSVRGREIGPDTFCMIAGPCTVRSYDATLATARAVQEAGATMLRGGAFKPRTSPFAFQGLGVEGLEILSAVRAATGLPVVTELLSEADAEVVAEHADVVQIGARNMQNYALLQVAGRLGLPTLIKRGHASTVKELLQAADYLLKEGNDRVVLCERGIRTFETATRFTLDLTGVAWLKRHTHLPVVVDPSHAAGDRQIVRALARAVAAVGADGLLVEVDADVEAAVCDRAHTIGTETFATLAREVRGIAELIGRRWA